MSGLSLERMESSPEVVKAYIAEMLLELTSLAAKLGAAELTSAIGAAAAVAAKAKAEPH